MKLLILASMVAVFISVVFVLFVLDDITNRYVNCERNEENRIVCNLDVIGIPFVSGLFFIGFFVIIDIFVLHFLFDAIKNH